MTEKLKKAKAAVEAWEAEHASGYSLTELAKAECFADYANAIQECMEHDKQNDILTLYFSYAYTIDLGRIAEPLDLVVWVNHLLKKEWMEKAYLKAFIQRVAAIKGWSLHL